MQIRSLTSEDFREIFEIWFKEIYRGAYLLLYSREEFFVRTFNDLNNLLRAQDACLLGIEERGKIVGAIMGYGQQNPSKVYCVPFLWIHPARRRQRHATTLAQVLIRYGQERGYRRFTCETDTKSPALKRLLKHLGYHQVRTIWLRVDGESSNPS